MQTHTFQHEAMKTTFTLRLRSADQKLAKQSAADCINLIDTIENCLSRYIEGSDIWQINHMQSGEMLFLRELSHECLQIALEAYVHTDGLFDITLGRQIEHRKNESEGPAPSLTGQLMLDPDRPAIHCIESGREIDLGGIGKGFALDQMKRLAKDWGVEAALLSAGASTLLAYGDKAWPITLKGDHSTRVIDLKEESLSVSGTRIQGSHIVSPTDEAASYAYNKIWLTAKSAAKADAYSTAALMMQSNALEALSKQVNGLYIETDGHITSLDGEAW